MLVIGLSGKMGSGKDFIARVFIYSYLKKYYPHLNIYFLAFADTLKMQSINHYHLNWEDVYPPPEIPKTESVRKILQNEGKIHRERNPNYWIQCYDNWVRLFQRNGCDILITTDIRYETEMSHIRNAYKGIVCKVYAPSRTYQTKDTTLMKDESEISMDKLSDQDYDYVFKNDNPFVSVEQFQINFRPFLDLLKKRLNNSQ